MPFVTKIFKFCAAHQYWNTSWSEEKNREVFGEDVRPHGHNYSLEITVSGEIDQDTGFIIDLNELKRLVNTRVIDLIDHATIEKDIPQLRGKQPSTENMVIWVWNQIEPELEDVTLHRVRLRETPTIYTDYFGPDE